MEYWRFAEDLLKNINHEAFNCRCERLKDNLWKAYSTNETLSSCNGYLHNKRRKVEKSRICVKFVDQGQ